MKLRTAQVTLLVLAFISLFAEYMFWAFGAFRGLGMIIFTVAWFCFITAFWITKLVRE